METVIALCPMLDVSVKWVKTYKSLRTVSAQSKNTIRALECTYRNYKKKQKEMIVL